MRSETVWESVASGVELATLEGHTGQVADLCTVAVEGRTLLVSAGTDGSLRIWDPAAGRQARVMHGHTEAVDTVLNVGGVLVSASRDRTVRTWNPVTGHQVGELTDHEGAIPVAVSGQTLVASATPDSVRLWDPRTGETRHVITGATGRAVACARGLVMAPAVAGGIGLWDLATGELRGIAKPDDHTTVDLCTITVGGQTLFASAGYDKEMEGGRIRLWDPATGEVVRIIEHEPLVAATLDRIQSVRAIELGGRERLVSVGHKTVRIWDQDTGSPLQAFIPPRSWAEQACFFRADGRDLLAIPERYVDSLCVWDTATGELVNQIQNRRGPTEALCSFELDGRTLLASADGYLRTVRLWDPLGPGTRPRPKGHTGDVYGVWAFHDKIVSVADESLRIWDPETGLQLRRIRGRMFGAEDVHAFTLDGRELLAGAFSAYEDGRIRIWDPAAGRQVRRLERRWDSGPTMVCSFSREGRVLLTAAHDHVLRIWDPATGKLEYEEDCDPELAWLGRITVDGGPALVANGRGHGVRIWHPVGATWQDVAGPGANFAFMLNDRPLVAAKNSKDPETLRIWNPLTTEEQCVLRGGAGTGFAGIGVLTLDGCSLLVTHGEQDRTVRVWDPTTGRCEHVIPIHHEVVGCAPLGNGLLATAVPSGLIVHRISP
jgi:WD40 repeat protein